MEYKFPYLLLRNMHCIFRNNHMPYRIPSTEHNNTLTYFKKSNLKLKKLQHNLVKVLTKTNFNNASNPAISVLYSVNSKLSSTTQMYLIRVKCQNRTPCKPAKLFS